MWQNLNSSCKNAIRICVSNLIKIGQTVLEIFSYKWKSRCDARVLYLRNGKCKARFIKWDQHRKHGQFHYHFAKKTINIRFLLEIVSEFCAVVQVLLTDQPTDKKYKNITAAQKCSRLQEMEGKVRVCGKNQFGQKKGILYWAIISAGSPTPVPNTAQEDKWNEGKWYMCCWLHSINVIKKNLSSNSLYSILDELLVLTWR